MRGSVRKGYDVAQVCLEGHVVTSAIKAYPEDTADHCDKCGARTITACPECDTPIRGAAIHGRNGWGPDSVSPAYGAPAFCHKCGEPYPWTATRIESAKELAAELNGLSARKREKLNKSIEDLIRDIPHPEGAAGVFVKLLSDAKGRAKAALYQFMVDVVSEAAAKVLRGESPGAP